MKRIVLAAALVFAASYADAQTIGVDATGQAQDVPSPKKTSDLSIGGFSFSFGGLANALLQTRDAQVPDQVDTEVIFVMTNGTIDAAGIANSTNIAVLETTPLESVGLTMVVAKLRKGDTPELAIGRLSTLPSVAWAQPNHVYQSLGQSRVLPKRFALEGLPTEPAAITTGTIAIIDTPVAITHEALKGASIREQIYTTRTDPGAHGTAIASLLVGTGEVPGAARGATLISLAAFEQKKDVALSQTRALAKAFDAAVRLKPDVLNLSFGGREDRLLSTLLDAVEARGICVAAAAGNGGSKSSVPFPATHKASLAVTAVDEKLQPYAYATPGMRIDVAGVGVELLAAVPGGYRRVSGTSFATAFVAGGLLRMTECNATHAPAAMRLMAKTTAQDLGTPGPDAVFGAGLFKFAAAGMAKK